jgi:hypothetical protein
VARKPKPGVDWKDIEAEYRAGKLSIRQIAANHGVDEKAIRKRADKGGWTRDLEPEVDRRVRNALVPVIGPQPGPQDEKAQAEAKAAEEETIDHAARRSIEVVLTHRKDIAEARDLVERMLAELNDQTLYRGAIEQLIEHVMAGGGMAGAMERAMLKQALTLPNRVKTLVNLSGALGNVVKLERQVFGLEEKAIVDPVEKDRAEKTRTGSRSAEELAKAMLGIVERAAREKAEAARAKQEETRH